MHHKLLSRNRWLLLRRTCQFSILALFLAGPWLGVWWLKGNLASSVFLGSVALTDPYMVIQSIAAGHRVSTVAITGALLVAGMYFLLGGRVYCSWVCPVNVITDLADWLRRKLRITGVWQPPSGTRHWILLMTLAVSWLSGSIAWELVNPITILQRGLVFGLGAGWVVILAVFLFDLTLSRRGWCGHICPVGAFYGLMGKASLIRIKGVRRQACTDCGDCYRVCPEPHVITPVLNGRDGPASSLVLSGDCTNCGRCIDVCQEDVFAFSNRFAGGSGSKV